MNEQNFDRLFREKLAGYSQSPPAGLAKEIEHQLVQQKRKAWWQFARVAAALALIAASVYLLTFLNSSPVQTNQIAGNKQSVNIPTPLMEPELNQTSFIEPPALVERITPIPQSKSNRISQPMEKTKSPVGASEPKSEIHESQAEDVLVSQVEEIGKTEKYKVTIIYKKASRGSGESQELAQVQPPESQQKTKNRKKFWRKAKMVDPSFTLAGLRATKDQLLAINKKEKESKPN